MANVPKYKRRKVFAVRDFPSGCGPNAPLIDGVTKEVAEHADNTESNGHVDKMSSAAEDGEDTSSLPKSDTDKESACSIEVEKAAATAVKIENHEAVNGDYVVQQLPKESDTVESKLVGCVNTETPKLSPSSEAPAGLPCKLSSDLGEGTVEEASTKKDMDDLVSRDEARDIVGAGQHHSVESDLLPHFTLPSNVVRKKKNYPPRRHVSAVRDFPTGCGPNAHPVGSNADNKRGVTSFEDNIVGQDEANSSFHEIKEQEIHDVGFPDSEKKPAAPEKSVDEVRAHAASNDEVRAQTESDDEVKACDFIDGRAEITCYSRKGRSAMGDAKNEVQCTVYQKENIDKVKTASVSRIESSCPREGIGNKVDAMNKVVVLGMAAASTQESIQQTNVRKHVQSTPSASSGKQSMIKKRVKLKEDVAKSEEFKRKETAEASERKSVKEVSASTRVTEGSPSTQQIVLWKDDHPENEKQHDDFQMVARSSGVALTLNPLPFGISGSTHKSARTKVRETLRLFQAIARKLLQEEEEKPKLRGNPTKRIDLLASSILKEKGMYLNNDKKIMGPVPGVEVGDEFHYRVELMMIGLHRQSQGGIDYVKQGGRILTTSIVASGGYDNVVCNSDELIYTGQGGNASGGDKQTEDQKLERGNLSLVNSIREKNFVRVIRGYKESNRKGRVVTTYTYDGLYIVEHYWADRGPNGKIIYKFRLRRCPGQRDIAWKELKASNKSIVREGCCVDDISGGREKVLICAVNTIDDEKPPPFSYITKMIYPEWCHPISRTGCDCINGCSDSEKCACAIKNGGEIPYNHDGAIVEAKPLVYECGPSCKCPTSCHNRVSQHGIQFKLEIFKTESRGWGVRSLSSIPSGSFICEYIGELLDDREAENRITNDEYLFDIGQNCNDHALGDRVCTLMPHTSLSSSDVVEEVGFTIDALQYGNVGRFINHSCSPNLYAQNVIYDHEDPRIPHVMFFAAENIPPLQELTYHYNYTIDEVLDANGNIKKRDCYCGSEECTGRMY